MKHRRRRSRTSSWHTTGHSLWPTRDAVSQRSLAAVLLVPASRNPIVERVWCKLQSQLWNIVQPHSETWHDSRYPIVERLWCKWQSQLWNIVQPHSETWHAS